MDRFKFRLFVTKNEAYPDKVGYAKEESFCILPSGEESFFDADYDFAECVVEQCTGLKDKNGKLIYENDLIKCPSGIYRVAVDDFGLWTAIYNNNPFDGVGEWSDMVKEYAFNQDNLRLEVLGNIHENADLLGEKK